MDKKALVDFLDCFKKNSIDLCTEGCPKGVACRGAEKELRRIISAHGGEEVGEEEREGLLKHFDYLSSSIICAEEFAGASGCSLCQQIRSLLRQPKRTVSREQMKSWVRSICDSDSERVAQIRLGVILSELGFEVEEPKGERRHE